MGNAPMEICWSSEDQQISQCTLNTSSTTCPMISIPVMASHTQAINEIMGAWFKHSIFLLMKMAETEKRILGVDSEITNKCAEC